MKKHLLDMYLKGGHSGDMASESSSERHSNNNFFSDIGFLRQRVYSAFHYDIQPNYDEDWLTTHMWWWRILPSEIHQILHIGENNKLNENLLMKWVRRAVSEHSYCLQHDLNIIPRRIDRSQSFKKEATVDDLFEAYKNGLTVLVSNKDSLNSYLEKAYVYELKSRIFGNYIKKYPWIDSEESIWMLFIEPTAKGQDLLEERNELQVFFPTSADLDFKLKTSECDPVQLVTLPEQKVHIDISKPVLQAIKPIIDAYRNDLKERVNKLKKETPWDTGRGKSSSFMKGKAFFRNLELFDKITLKLPRFNISDYDYSGKSEIAIDSERRKALIKEIKSFR